MNRGGCFCLLFALLSVGTRLQTAFGQTTELVIGVIENGYDVVEEPSGAFSGLSVEIWKKIAEKLNLDYRYQKYTTFGVRNEQSGTWSGVVGKLVNQEIDISITPMVVAADLLEHIRFSIPLRGQSLTLLQRPPLALQTTFEMNTRSCLPIAPYSVLSLVLFLAATFVVGVVLALILRFNPRERGRLTGLYGRGFTVWGCCHAFGESFLFLLSVLSLQGWSGRRPRALSTRFLSIFWFLFVIINLGLYIAGLTTQLRALSYSRTVTTLPDPPSLYAIIENTSMPIELPNEVIPMKLTMSIKESLSSEMEKIAARLSPTGDFASKKKELEDASTAEFALAIESGRASFQPKCDRTTSLVSSETTLSQQSVAFAFQKTADTLEGKVSQTFLELAETGELARIEQQWIDKISLGCKASYSNVTAPSIISLDEISDGPVRVARGGLVTLKGFMGALIVYGVGLCLTAVAAIVQACRSR